MPIFEFKCQDCGKQFEELIYRSDEPVACPICGSGKAEKMVSTFASNAFAGHSSTGCSDGSCSKKSSFG
jgi:putative FmdB family regulatory protein